MRGGEPSIRIERADNGFLIDAYTPGNGDGPGDHKRMVASTPEQALKLARPHMVKIGKKKNRRGREIGTAAAPSSRKRASRKRAG